MGTVSAAGSDPTQHLGVEVNELARSLALVPDDRWPGREAVQSAKARTPQDRVHRAPSETRLPGQDVRPDAQFPAAGTQAVDELGRMSTGLVWTALERSVSAPVRARHHHFEPVCRLIPAASAAAVIVQPAWIRSARSCRPWGVRRALGCAMRVPSSTVACNTNSRTIGALSPSTT